ncbi:MAG: hypothetical protein JWR44_2004 [Hymenobacter sp.]|jgi:hypothetical protein|nr:hypothetical protein [Hymenobacter sp.]
MKKVLLLAIAGLFTAVAPALAHPPAANVNFTSERGVPFGLVLDGRPLTRGAARQVHVDQLAPGQHWADFSVPAAYGGVVRFRSRVWLQPGLETSFVLIARPGRPLDLRQVAAVPLYRSYNGPGRGNGYNNGPGYDSYNRPAPYNQGSTNGYPSNGSPNNGYPNNGGYGRNAAPNPGYGNNPNGPAGGYNNAPNNPYPGTAVSSYRPLAPQDVDALVQAVKQRSFEASKLSMAKEALAQSSLQADDLARLLRSFDFEASRVDLAKFAYAHLEDPENFYRVYDSFEFEASAREVEQAVAPDSQR